MTDVWESTQASIHLRGRRNEDTKPELMLRRQLHRLGARYRLQRRVAPRVTADLVLPRYGLAVFVDGDFWHGCPDHGVKEWRGPNAERWRQKLARTQARDARGTQAASEAGWTVVRLWECQILADPEAAARKVLESGREGPRAAPQKSTSGPGPKAGRSRSSSAAR